MGTEIESTSRMFTQLRRIRLISLRDSLLLGNQSRFLFSEVKQGQTSEPSNSERKNARKGFDVITQSQFDSDPNLREIYEKNKNEWTKLAEENLNRSLEAIKTSLSIRRQRKVEFVNEEILKMSPEETLYFGALVRDLAKEQYDFDLFAEDIEGPSEMMLTKHLWPPRAEKPPQETPASAPAPTEEGKDKEKEKAGITGDKELDELLAALDIEKYIPKPKIVAAADAPAQAEEKVAKVEVKQEEKKIFDVELSAVDPAQKIKAIKEIRQLFNLGLKEAKDLVEKAPVILKKDLKKEDAEKMREQLTPHGLTINLL
eukprot:TRINITY_DN1754_c0_g1_i3.p1 TRINITY_DN1754_c0_g1~~TRINITY_DN1754_c0_g1_i3.p1  ORF type:complete len:348 (+),score=123.09 TRINITY_DN1754_c0_g1_i3:100-1044(+)